MGLPPGSISQVTLRSQVTLEALSHASYAYDAYRSMFPLSLVSAGQAVMLLRTARACGNSKKLSNQCHDALTPIREVQSQKIWSQAHLPNASLYALDLEELKF